MKFVIVFAILAVISLQLVYGDDKWKCEPKVPYKENECNGCFCNERGDLGCTEMACLNNDRSLYNCKPGTVTEKGCNTCVCVEQLGTICTDKKC